MVTATFRIVVHLETKNDVLKTLRPLIGPTEAQPGCVSCRMHQDVDDANALTLVEQWETQADLNRHIASNDFRRVLAVLDLSIKPPEIRFDGVSHTAGIELIEAVRSAKAMNKTERRGR